MIAYQTAYLKTYHPNEFIAASMSNELSNTDKLSEFFEELKRLKIKVQRPCINECYPEFIPQENTLFYALGAIKNVGFHAITQVVKEREKNGKFKSIGDFVNRVNPKDINKLQLEGLVKAGAFRSEEHTSELQSRTNLVCRLLLEKKKKKIHSLSLFYYLQLQQVLE